MDKKEFLNYLIDNLNYLSELEKKLLVDFVFSLNESFIKDLFEKLLKTERLNYKNILKAYEELLNEEALKLARNSKIKFDNEEERYEYDPLELLKFYYYEKLKNNKLKKGFTCKA